VKIPVRSKSSAEMNGLPLDGPAASSRAAEAFRAAGRSWGMVPGVKVAGCCSGVSFGQRLMRRPNFSGSVRPTSWFSNQNVDWEVWEIKEIRVKFAGFREFR
jgi:hypothetical protein